ncbi:MAG: hypothetical protein ABSA65_02575 [Acidimicrobiales bacterium]
MLARPNSLQIDLVTEPMNHRKLLQQLPVQLQRLVGHRNEHHVHVQSTTSLYFARLEVLHRQRRPPPSHLRRRLTTLDR